ncbi:hypothetical protein [Aureimonas sp. AU4]|uniref:hypothetical protein n=1 Tax=Aureimonas sp. AU4 TaxID=1638163 RepID=UPI000783682F|nr:hypothetical protein [Aureimonas sp. AU4]
MCQTAYRTDTGDEIASLGDIRKLVGSVNIAWNGKGDDGRERGAALSDLTCLCWVDLRSTLIAAGYEVRHNPNSSAEYLCEKSSDGA